MGERNESFDPEEAASNLLDGLGKYLYDHYGSGDEPWETAGKRVREHWEEEARSLLNHVADWFVVPR